MRKVIKIGFPILCVAVIGGTFILLNKTTDRINRNKLNENEVVNSATKKIVEEVNQDNTIVNTSVDSEDAKAQEVKNKAKAIEIVKKLAPPSSNVYYTNEGMVGTRYLVAIRDNTSKDVKIYYSVNIDSEQIEIYEK